MERTCENWLKLARLSPDQRREFYNRLKGLVVGIEAGFNPPEDGSSMVKREGQNYMIGGETAINGGVITTLGSGFIINEDGWILTCAHVVPKQETLVSLQFCLENARNDYKDAILVSRNDDLDLAILRPVDSITTDYAKLSPGSDEVVNSGMEVFMISHQSCLFYTYSRGQIALPNYQVLGEIKMRPNTNDEGWADSLRVIPSNNLHTRQGASGGPVFDARGRVIGIHSFRKSYVSFSVHVKEIKTFLEPFQKKPIGKLVKEKREREEEGSSTKISRKGGSSSTKRGTSAH